MKKFKVLLTCVLSISMICGCSQLSAPESTTSAPTSAPATTQASQASDQPEASEAPGPELEPIRLDLFPPRQPRMRPTI